MRQRDKAEETDQQSQRRRPDSQRCSTDRRRRNAGREEERAAASKRTELGDEPIPALSVAYPYARDEWKPHADVVAVLDHYVIETLQLGAQQFEIIIE